MKLKGFARIKLWDQHLCERELKGISVGKGWVWGQLKGFARVQAWGSAPLARAHGRFGGLGKGMSQQDSGSSFLGLWPHPAYFCGKLLSIGSRL